MVFKWQNLIKQRAAYGIVLFCLIMVSIVLYAGRILNMEELLIETYFLNQNLPNRYFSLEGFMIWRIKKSSYSMADYRLIF